MIAFQTALGGHCWPCSETSSFIKPKRARRECVEYVQLEGTIGGIDVRLLPGSV